MTTKGKTVDTEKRVLEAIEQIGNEIAMSGCFDAIVDGLRIVEFELEDIADEPAVERLMEILEGADEDDARGFADALRALAKEIAAVV
jgi:hypothetical protein